MTDINVGRYDTNEMVYAQSLLPQIPDDSLTVFDKDFVAARVLCGLTMSGRNRHFLIPAKSHTCWEGGCSQAGQCNGTHACLAAGAQAVPRIS